MGYHVVIEADNTNGSPVGPEVVDMAGGRLAVHEPAISFSQDEPRVGVTLYAEAENPAEALAEAIMNVWLAFSSLGIPLAFRSASVYTEAEFDRVRVNG